MPAGWLIASCRLRIVSGAQRCNGALASIALFAALLPVAGCQSLHATESEVGPPLAELDNPSLVERIQKQPWITADAGYRAIYVVWKGEVFSGDFGALQQELVDGHIVSHTWKDDSDTLLTRAKVGYMVCRALGIRTGLNWQLTGLGRYAWRELYYAGIVDAQSEHGLVSGGQFIGILSRADQKRDELGLARPTDVDLGPEPQ